LTKEDKKLLENLDVHTSQAISWYPGHIAKAEKELLDYLRRVDVVIEVRDARIPYATTHPSVPKWIGNKPLIVAIGRVDQVSSSALRDWKNYYETHPAHPERPDAKVFFIDGKHGTGVLAVKREALKAGVTINEKRIRRGIQPRAVRAAVIGFPNVGKSALINRLLGRRLAKSQDLPGVTRQLTWVRIGGATSGSLENSIELLDSPGIIPAQQFNQYAALRLAICNDIGQASYDRVVVAGKMCDMIKILGETHPNYVNMNLIKKRYPNIDFDELSGEEIVDEIARRQYHDNVISAADRLLSDFRKNLLQFGSLEAPIVTEKNNEKLVEKNFLNHRKTNKNDPKKEEILEYSGINPLDVGKGNYEGW
jgi:ribosome biogenesis GTPase A